MFATYNYFRQYNNNKPIENYKEFYKKFSNEREFGGEFTNYDHLVKNRFMNIMGHIYNIILRKQPQNLIDIGSGNGVNLPFAKVFPSIDYHAVDYAKKTIEKAKKQYPNIKFQVADAFRLPYTDKQFDMSILSSILILYEDEKQRIALLKEAQRVINDNGILILVVWNESYLLKKSIQISRILAKIKKQNLPQDFMGYHFKYTEIEKLAMKSGFKIEECIHTAHLYGILESVKYLNMSKYNRQFGKAECQTGKIYNQNILKDLINEAGKYKYLTQLFYYISKLNPNLFSMFSIYVLAKEINK